MKTPNHSSDHIPFIVKSDMTIGNYRFSKRHIKSVFPHIPFKNKDKMHLISRNNGSRDMEKKIKYENGKFNYSITDSCFSSDTQRNKQPYAYKNYPKKVIAKRSHTEDEEIPLFTETEKRVYCSYNGTTTTIESSTIKNYESDESFMTKINWEKDKFYFINPKEEQKELNKPLRLFNKNGKPLTDRMGRPLIDILGQPLVLLDNKGLLKSDYKGNQVFNTLGQSAIYSNTNLYIPPSEEEPGIPILDSDKKHIIYLYDNKGHPLTDGLGRPLINASGRPMFGLKSCEDINLNNFKHYQLKNLYSKAPLENFVRRVQIFNSDLKPLTDEAGTLLKGAKIICNRDGMPMCDETGRSLIYKYGIRITAKGTTNLSSYSCAEETSKYNPSSDMGGLIEHLISKDNKHICPPPPTDIQSETSDNINNKGHCEGKNCKNHNAQDNKCSFKFEKIIEDVHNSVSNKMLSKNYDEPLKNDEVEDAKIKNNTVRTEELSKIGYRCTNLQETCINVPKNVALINQTQENKENLLKEPSHPNDFSKEPIILFDNSKRLINQKSSVNTVLFQSNKGKTSCQTFMRKKPKAKINSTNLIQYLKNALNLSAIKQTDKEPIYNNFGKPIKDFYGSLIYDQYGIPLTGAHGIELSEKARNAIRVQLRNIPVFPLNKEGETSKKVQRRSSNDPPFYDKHGRPLYDLFGSPIYDVQGLPLADAFGRPLIDAMGRHLLDSEGKILSSLSRGSSSSTLHDIFGRRLYEKRGRPIFDSYGRPRFDIFTNAIYDNCGRPATDANGNTLYDFLNKPIQPHPEKPLYKNARTLLPKYIDKILAMPCMYQVLKYSRTTLKDVFGGPIFDDCGRPLYNKIGKPLYDKYGRPLYDKNGKPLCDCYGRPLSEELQQYMDDQTLSVVDSLKLLKLTKASKCMEIKQSRAQKLKSVNQPTVPDNATDMKILKPAKEKSTQYIYALTRVTNFTSGRQALEILEAPLSESTAREMHHLPVDNKPLIMVERLCHQRVGMVKKHRAIIFH